MSELRAHAPRLAGALCLWAALVLWGSDAIDFYSSLTTLPLRESAQIYRLCVTAAAAPFMMWPFLVRSRRLAFWLPLGAMLGGAAVLAMTQALPPAAGARVKPAPMALVVPLPTPAQTPSAVPGPDAPPPRGATAP
ncbi:hypothetical protein K2X14_08395 [Acetobacter sp. TBRC 12305]|uniref:Uncharacterized protein n=1 Tax=Acetobacter garciniae TaxID=2817435 RepID=A0A939KN20_9PROT|nr:hypothetical protein [Acetobacter garciniae]MBO1325180.1 hypothetical protein [Acetobacter garciniae]MBX0344849.1 hypothetical protein [Acetobacter garciniae]